MKGKIRAALKQEWVHCSCYKPPRIGASPPWGEINFLPLIRLSSRAAPPLDLNLQNPFKITKFKTDIK